MKDRAAFAPDDPRNPWSWVYQRCTGEKVTKPRRKAAKHIYANEITNDLNSETNDVVNSKPGSKQVEVWQRLLGSRWKSLSEDRKAYYQRKSDAKFEREMKEYEMLLKKRSNGINDPEVIQKFVNSIHTPNHLFNEDYTAALILSMVSLNLSSRLSVNSSEWMPS
jgi:hypothetical protein